MIRSIGLSSFCLPGVRYLPLIKSRIWNPGIRASFKGCLRLIFIATQLPKLNVKLTYCTRNPETGGPQVPSWPRKHGVTPLGKQHKTKPSHLFKKMDIFFITPLFTSYWVFLCSTGWPELKNLSPSYPKSRVARYVPSILNFTLAFELFAF